MRERYRAAGQNAAVLSQSVEPKCALDPPCRGLHNAPWWRRAMPNLLYQNLTALKVGQPCECA
jgi:hypothetical protein